MSTNELINQLGAHSRRELLIDATISYLFSLAPELTDAIFRGAVLRWFNTGILGDVLGVGIVSNLQMPAPDTRMVPRELHDQLCRLPFTEEYLGRGYSFHDLTRELVLSYLWEKELDFYRKVSARAVKYFEGLLNTHIDQSERGEIDPVEVDWDLGVEQVYHYIIADEQQAIAMISSFLDYLLQQRRLGTYHAVIQAILEHADAGRVSPDFQAWLKLWRLQEAVANYDIAGLEKMASEILQAPDTSVPGWLKAEATYILADGLSLTSRYDEAERYLRQNIDQYRELENVNGVVRAVKELGMVELCRENYKLAANYFADALELHVQQLRVPAQEDSQFKDDTPLRVVDPAAWHRRELYPTDEAEDQQERSSHPRDDEEISQEEEPQGLILYFIGFDIRKLGIDTAGLSEDESLRYEWPVDYDDVLAELWLNLAYVHRALDLYDMAAACARLSGQMYEDLDNLSGAQAAVMLLQSLGANLGDLEYVKAMEEFEYELFRMAVARKDQRAVLSGLISQAGSQFEMDRYEEARVKYEKAYSLAESLNLANEKATCLDGLARLYWTWGEYDQALERFRSALELYKQVQNQEGWADSMLSLGTLLQARNQFDEADQCFHRALDTYEELQTFSGRFNSLSSLSGVATTKGNYEGSFKYLDQALQLSQSRKDTRLYSQVVALSNLAGLHLSLGHFDQAKDLLAQALHISDRIGNQQLSVSVLLDKAGVLSDMAEYALAVEVYDQVIERDPSNSSAYSGKAWALENVGKEKAAEASRAYEKLSELRPHDWWVHKGIANALRLSGDKQAATIKYRWVVDQIEQEGVRPTNRSALAWCCYQLGEYEKAENIYRQVVDSVPDPISDYFDLGLVFLCRKRYSEALKAYGQAVVLLQQRYPPLRRLGLIYVAIDDLQEAIQANPKLSGVEDCNRIRELLSEQQRLAQGNPDGKPNRD